MCRRINRLPPVLQHNRAYHQRTFFAWENKARRAMTEVRDFQPGEDYDDLAAATNDDDEDDGNKDAPPAVKPEVLMPEDYDKDASVVRALAE
jgi:hypothetical protein